MEITQKEFERFLCNSIDFEKAELISPEQALQLLHAEAVENELKEYLNGEKGKHYGRRQTGNMQPVMRHATGDKKV